MNTMTRYEKWLDMFKSDDALVSELTAIKDDPKEIEDRFYTPLSFGTAGMRGVIGYGENRINIYTVRRASAGLALHLLKNPAEAQKGVAIAYDARRYSDVFAMETALTLAAYGIPVYLFDSLRPVPVLSYTVRHLKTAAGVVITASHNPPQYNGYKAYGPDGAQLSPQEAQSVTEAIYSLGYDEAKRITEDEARAKGLLHIIGKREVDDDYTAMVLGLAITPNLIKQRGHELKIVYTPLHGSGNLPVRRVLKEAGFTDVTVVPEQELPDPAFPTVKAPNPEDPDAFKMAIPLAEKVGATVCFGTDPDCDRLGVAVKDGQGTWHTLTGNQIGCLLLNHVLAGRKRQGTLPQNGAAVKSIVSTQMARAICEDYGVAMFDVLTGFKFIGEKMESFEETGDYTFLFGFEESFGYLSGNFVRDKDAVNASLLIAEAALACLDEGITLYDRLMSLYERYGYYVEKVHSVTLPGKDGLEKMKATMQSLRDNTPQDIGGLAVTGARDYLSGKRKTKDGVTKMGYPPSDVLYYELTDGNWVCVRPSGTEPKIKLYVNTVDKNSLADAEALNAKLLKASEELMGG